MASNATFAQKIRPNQRRAIETLVATGNVSEAAAAAGVVRQTVYKWMAGDEVFKAALYAAETVALHSLQHELLAMTEEAIRALKELLASEKDSVKLRAVDLVFNRLLQIREKIVLEERVAVIEGALKEIVDARSS
jgi:transposase-like protein